VWGVWPISRREVYAVQSMPSCKHRHAPRSSVDMCHRVGRGRTVGNRLEVLVFEE
jgi:hypothetical protein